MKIGVNTLFMIPHEVGGSETYLRENLKALLAATDRHEWLVFSNVENDSLWRGELRGNVTIVPTGVRAMSRPSRILHEQFMLPRLAAKQGLHVLWSPGNSALLMAGMPQVVTVYDMQYRSHPEDFGLMERLAIDTLLRSTASRCRAVLTISEFSRSEIIRYTGVPADHVVATPLGVKSDFADDRPPECGAKPYLLCIANTYPHKNVDVLVEAFALLEDDIPHDLVLVGKQRRGEAKVRSALVRLKNPTRVRRLENMDAGRLRGLYKCSALFVFPSSYEGFGLPVIEAMLARVPVLTTALAAIPEVGGDTVHYIPTPNPATLADAIRRILAQPAAVRDAMLDRAQERAREFTWEKTAACILTVLEAAGEGGSGR